MTELERKWVGRNIKNARLGREMSQKALAQEITERSGGILGLHQCTISNWEKGRQEISPQYRRFLVEALDVPRETIFEAPPEGWAPPRDLKAAA